MTNSKPSWRQRLMLLAILSPFFAVAAVVAASYLRQPDGFLESWLDGIERARPRRLAASRVDRLGVRAALRQWLDPAHPIGDCADMADVIAGQGPGALDGLREILTAAPGAEAPAIRRCAAQALVRLCQMDLHPREADSAWQILSALQKDSDPEVAAIVSYSR